MSKLKTIMSSLVLIANELFAVNEMNATNKFCGIEVGDELSRKYEKLSKTRKMSKSQKLSNQEIQKAKNWLNLKNYQKVGIHLILILKRSGWAFNPRS